MDSYTYGIWINKKIAWFSINFDKINVTEKNTNMPLSRYIYSRIIDTG